MKYVKTYESFLNESDMYIDLVEETIRKYYLADTKDVEISKEIRSLVKELCKLHNKGISTVEIAKKFPNKEGDLQKAINAYNQEIISRSLPQNWESPSTAKIEKII